MNNNILTFFFGSPYSGFSSFPPNYSNWVSGLDTKKSEFPVICKYSIKDNKTIFKYVEYGLADDERTGRNFGIWLQIENYKLKSNKELEVLDFIKDFVNEILEEKEVFFKKGKKPHFYIIKSFKNVDTENIIKIFNDEFIKQFQNELIPIQTGDFFEKDLIVYEKPKKKEQERIFTTIDNNHSNLRKKELQNENKEKSIKERLLSSFHLSTSTVLLLSFVFLSFLYSFWNNITTNEKFKELQQEVTALKTGNKKSPKKLKVTKTETKEKKEEKSSKGKTKETESISEVQNYVIVKSGGLWQVVDNYNKENGTSFTLEYIAKYNKIKSKVEKNKNGKSITDYPLQLNQKIYFP